jgi:hypothetical protein
VTRIVLALAVVFGILVLTPSPSWACSCALGTTAQQVKRAATVASGTVDWTATDGQTRTFQVDFDSVYKGAAAESEKLTTAANEAACGVSDLATGRRYLFFIDGQHPGAMRIGLCGGTTPYDEALAQKVESVAGPPGKPLAAGTVDAPADDERGRTVTIALGAGALLLVAMGAAFAMRRRG